MEIASKYNPTNVESKWYEYWMENAMFSSKPDNRPAYTVVIPPPNVTGVLHMGHMLNNTIQDILVRRARMLGMNACWVPGTDHASIATEAKVVNRLANQGISKADLSREDFLKHAWNWTDEHGGIILKQLRKLGASCDWDRTAFTMDKTRSKSVIKVFCDLYNKGLIYKGIRMVNWDPQALTALSDEEVIFKEQNSKLYYLRYMVEGGNGEYAVVATTRPETIMGDTAMCINPNDEKNSSFKGKRVIVPLVGRSIPVIEDEYVDVEFGTGCLKVTPAHDVNDYMLGEKHNLDSINIFNDNGTLSAEAEMYVGIDRFEVRKQIIIDLENAGLVEKIEDYTNKVGYSERTNVVIEPKLSMQWFLKMEHLSEIALIPVMNDEIKFYPAKYKNTYRHWLENIKDWCISRQLWWGHQIPAYYINKSTYVVAESREEALVLAKEKTGNHELTISDLRQEEDCLDTWFSSWLWPISLFDGISNPNNEEINYYYPTADLVTGPDIIFFWVARMIMAGYEYKQEMPFKNVYFTGIVRDNLGRKMSKSLGNSPDPLDLIEKYSADGVRMGMMLAAPAGNDILFDESLCEQGRNFNNKIWNMLRLIKGWSVSESIEQPESACMAINWFESRMSEVITMVNDDFSKYRISEALMAIYKLIWDDFSSWYLELIKPAYQSPIDAKTLETTLLFFEKLMALLHPYMPFITEEIWQNIRNRKKSESIMLVDMPKANEVDQTILSRFEVVKDIIANIRTVRLEKNIANKVSINLNVTTEDGFSMSFAPIIKKMCNVECITLGAKEAASALFMVGTTEYSIPLGNMINKEEEIAKAEEEIQYLEGFLVSVMKKLSNERFVANAKPEIVDNERKKQTDTEAKIKQLRATIETLK